MVVDLGTGDGRAVLARAAAEPRTFVIGIDANAAALAESSRRAARGRGAQRLPNAWFAVESAEALPGPLAGVASTVTVVMPWGSLLRGVLGLDDAVLRGTASIVAPEGRVEILASVMPADGVVGLVSLDGAAEAAIARAWAAVGFELVSMRPSTAADLRRTRSSWARRLGNRPLWRIELVRRQPGQLPPDRSFGVVRTTSESSPAETRSPGLPRVRAPAGKMGDTIASINDPSAPARAGRQRRTCERGQGDDAPAR